MDALLLALAITLQLADGAYTCHRLGQGARELNPLVGQSCGRVAAIKAAAFMPVPFLGRRRLIRRVYLGSLAAAGGVGLGVSIALRD